MGTEQTAIAIAFPAWATDVTHPLYAIEMQARQLAEAAIEDWADEATVDEAAVGYYRGIFDRLRREAMVVAVRPLIDLKAKLMIPFVGTMVITNGHPVQVFRPAYPPSIAGALAEADRQIEAIKLIYFPELARESVPQPYAKPLAE